MPALLILNGPNLNMLGLREPDIYGRETLHDIEQICKKTAESAGFSADFRQTNHEGQLVDWIQEAALKQAFDGLIINAGAYTHTSVALHDALRLLDIPIIEVHLSDPKSREPFRHISYVESLAKAVITGKGAKGYAQAIEKMADLIGAGRA